MPEEHRQQLKQIVAEFRQSLYDFDRDEAAKAVQEAFSQDATVYLCHPFETLGHPENLLTKALLPLSLAMPDLERRDTIVMAGTTPAGDDYVGCCGYYTGTFQKPFLNIPPTGHMAAMRFHEFFKIEGTQVVEFQGLWDIPELMMQANAWPMPVSLGREWQVPAPATQDGVSIHNKDEQHAEQSLGLVSEMLAGLSKFAEGGVEAMNLTKYWHPKMSWYGPSGIGTGRGLQGFRNWHQIPFLNGMPDRSGTSGVGTFFADGDYVGTTGWPNMRATITGDGWMGIAPAGQEITMRSLDFWRCENGLIRENWVLVDLLNVYHQIGVDVLNRMREVTSHYSGGTQVDDHR